MAQIIKAYRQGMPALRFIGKKYGDDDRVNGMFSVKWGEWFQNDWFAAIEKHIGDAKADFEDSDAYIGLMWGGHDEPFAYWIGMFAPENTAVPDGFAHVDFPKSEWGICWLYGKEGEVYCQEGLCADRLQAEGFELTGSWCFERYACPRFTTPDEKGNIILDIGFQIK